MVKYRIKVRNGSNIEIGEFTTFRKVDFGKRLNNYGELSFEVPAGDSKAALLISLREYTVWIYEENAGVITLIWSGEQALRRGTLAVDKNNWVKIICFTWFEQFNNRFTEAERVFTGVDQGEIMMTLFEETQAQTNGDFLITEGTIVPTFDRDRQYFNQNIMQAVIDLTNVISGFDFEITDNREVNADAIIGTDLTDSIVLEYGHNITECTITEDFSNPVNRGIVLGEAEGETDLQRVERNDTASQAIYKVREDTMTDRDISDIDTFEEKGDALIQKYGTPLFILEIDLLSSAISITSFSIGDLIRIIIKYGIYDIDETYRIFEWTISLKEDNTQTLKLVLGNFNI